MRPSPSRLSGIISLRPWWNFPGTATATLGRLIQLAAFVLALSGCATLRPGPTPPVQPSGPKASLKVHVPSPVEAAAGNEIRCQIQSIDGTPADASEELPPGKHRLIVTLNSLNQEYVGEVELIIPEPRNYRLKAERKEDAFTLSLVDVESSRTVATSTAPAAARMRFLVFVIQK